MASSGFGQAFEGLKSSELYEPPPAGPPPAAAAGCSVGSGYSILVNHRQRGNPILKAICSVPWEFSDIQPDYVLGAKTCALFLSLRYHQLNPGYAAERVQALGAAFELRVLLVQVRYEGVTISPACLLGDGQGPSDFNRRERLK